MTIIAKISRAPLHVKFEPSGSEWALPSGDDAPWVSSYGTTRIELKSGRYRVTQISGDGSPHLYTAGFSYVGDVGRDAVVESSIVWVYLTDSYAPGEVIIQPI